MQRNLRRNAEVLVSQGYEVDVICQKGRGQKSRETINGVNILRLSPRHHRGKVLQYLFDYTVFFFLTFFTLGWRSVRRRYRVVEVETMPDFLVFATLVPRLFGARVILYMFENMPGLFASTYKVSSGHPAVRLLTLITRLCAIYAHRVLVSDGEHHKKWVESLGIPGDKITLIFNVPDEKIFSVPEPSASTPRDSFRVLVLSTFSPRYGVETMVRATSRLLEHIPNLKVDLVGDGECRPALETLAKELGVDRCIRFTGWRPHEEVPGYIAAADVAVAPMIDDVGLPNKMFDYFSMSKPCVASALPSLKIAFDGDTVSFFSPGNDAELATCILELYHNPQKRVSLGSRGYAFYQERRWAVMKKRYLKVYRECLGLPEETDHSA
jgi:glycosyltransferase involved in cell wall biosynthesis